MYNNTTPFVSGFLDLQPVKNIYISSPNLGSYSTIGPTGQQTIIKKYQCQLILVMSFLMN